MEYDSKQRLFKQWLIKAPAGLATIGLGCSLLGDSILAKGRSAPFLTWFTRGTLALIVINTGISIFGDAIKARALLDWTQQQQILGDRT